MMKVLLSDNNMHAGATRFCRLLALLSAISVVGAQKEVVRDHFDGQLGDGGNACSNYHLLVPEIPSGEGACDCHGRTVKCEYDMVCASDNCAIVDLTVDLRGADFSVASCANFVSPSTPPEATTSERGLLKTCIDLEIVQRTLVDCEAYYNTTEQPCECSLCNDNSGVNVDCSVWDTQATTNGCQVLTSPFRPIIPAFSSTSSRSVVNSLEASENANRARSSATSPRQATTTTAAALFLMLGTYTYFMA